MDNINKIQRNISTLLNGVDPITGEKLSEEKWRNYLQFYTLKYLGYVLEELEKFKHGKRQIKSEFSLMPSEIEEFSFSERPLRISEIVDRFMLLTDMNCKKLKSVYITNYLVNEGYLYLENQSETRSKKPTDKGKILGISTRDVQKGNSMFTYVLYNYEAQKFIVEHFDEIMKNRGVLK